jgi:ATP-dependent helicase/nuclease subunit A
MPSSKTEFTAEQARAIQTRDVSIALSAGAGCGKTFVLTERFLSHLAPAGNGALPDDQLHQLIAITFTDRAAREMRDRIRDKCYQRLETSPLEEVDRWLTLLRNLDSARISTIHAFCGALLRSHAVEAQLDPRFTVIEQSQADTLLAEIIEDTVREILSDAAAPLHKPLVNLIVQFGLERLPSQVVGLLSSGRSIDFDAWLSRSPSDLARAWAEHCREVVLPQVLRRLSDSSAGRELLGVVRELSTATGELRNRCDVLSTLLPNLSSSRNPAHDLDAILQNARVQGAGAKKNWPDDSLYERFKDAAEVVRAEVKSAQRFLEFDTSTAQIDAEAGLHLLALANEVSGLYEHRKQEFAWLDFSDLLIRAQKLLTDPTHADLQQRLASNLQLLLVDECQDTDPLQVELIKALCGKQQQNGKLFFVGDFKQSIYRFRGADPGVFRRLQQETPPAGQMPLSMNFRSQPAILHFVNALFCEALSINNDSALAYQPLRPARKQITPTPAVEFLWAISQDQKSQAGARNAARRQEADFIARRIRQMLDSQETIVGERQPDRTWSPRAVEQRDIAILFRALSDVQHYEERLQHYGIDYYLVGGHAFYAQQEIYDITNLLRALASPADTISLAGVLRSPMFALTDETLFWLARHREGLTAGLNSDPLPAEIGADQLSRAEFAAKTLQKLRRSKDRLSITGLLNEALALTGYDATLLADFMGPRKLANLRKLLDQARVFDQSGVLGLADFIVQLSQFVVEQPREPLAATNPEGTDVVRLMTIHQAKGLEFPVVFVADVGRENRQGDRTAVWNPELGPLVKVPRRGDGPTISGIDLHATLSAAEDQQERIRLFYVATTRAADYLVLSGGLFHQELESPSTTWLKLLGERFDLQTGECRAKLPREEVFQRPGVKMTTVAPPVERAGGEKSSRHGLDEAIERVLSIVPQRDAEESDSDRYQKLANPVAVDRAARRRFSVSRLSGELDLIEDVATTMSLAEDDVPHNPSASADLGTLAHQVLARMPFDNPAAFNEIIDQTIEAHAARSAEHAQSVQTMMAQFLQSNRARDLAAAKTLYRELDFLLAFPWRVKGAECYLQGIIDCLYQDALGRWHIIDYKTNRVSDETLPAVAAKYEMQLGVYALAVEKILQQPPIELTLHFLRTGAEFSFRWNDELRKRMIERVNQAIDRIVLVPAIPSLALQSEP